MTSCESPRMRYALCLYCRGLTCSCFVGQLHFAHPSVYNEIYNVQNKWDKDYKLYRAFDMDESFFVQSSYLKSKHSRALLSNFFSKQTISELQHLIRSMVRVHLPFRMCQPSHSHLVGPILRQPQSPKQGW